MIDPTSTHALWILLIGAAILLAALVKAACAPIRFPSVVGFLGLGLLFRLVDDFTGIFTPPVRQAFAVLADLGIVALLFRVGLDSNLKTLLAKLPQAGLIWVGDVTISGSMGFFAARYWIGFDFLASLVIATAFTATSVGISAGVWDESGVLQSANGGLLIDVAELDDISGVVLMALLFAVTPLLQVGGGLGSALVTAGTAMMLKFAVFAGACFLISRYVEPPVTRVVTRLAKPPQRMLTVAGVGFMIAALAAWLEFSLAIGALLGGLAFSGDPEAVKSESRFNDLYAFFVPFFFIGIGLQTDLTSLTAGMSAGSLLLVAAVVGKWVGAGLPAMLVTSPQGGALIGASMIPRAEIAMVIAGQAHASGVLSQTAHAAILFVSITTCIVATWLVHGLLARWPQHPITKRKEQRE